MRRIGQSDNGMILFEMAPDEAFIFNRLTLAIEGKMVNDLIMRGDSQGYSTDYSGVFGAIIAFAEAKFRVNEIRMMTDEFERVLFSEENSR